MTLHASDYTLDHLQLFASRQSWAAGMGSDSAPVLADFTFRSSLFLHRAKWTKPAESVLAQAKGKISEYADPQINPAAAHSAGRYLRLLLELSHTQTSLWLAFSREIGHLLLDLYLLAGGQSGFTHKVIAEFENSGNPKDPNLLYTWSTNGDWQSGLEGVALPDSWQQHRPRMAQLAHGFVAGLDRILILGQPLPDSSGVVGAK